MKILKMFEENQLQFVEVIKIINMLNDFLQEWKFWKLPSKIVLVCTKNQEKSFEKFQENFENFDLPLIFLLDF